MSSFRCYLPDASALAIYLVLAIVVTWPVIPNLSAGIVGEVGGVDAYQDAWYLWWNAEALRHGRLPFFTPLLFYPNGVDLFWQTLGFSQGLAALPVTLALGPLAAFNITIVTSFVIGGYATFLFARHLTASVPAALVAGAIFAFSPYHIDKVIEGNLPLASVHWLPCYGFSLYLLLERPSWWRALLSGLLLLWVSLGSWYYGLFGVLFTACAAGIWAIGAGRTGWLRIGLWAGAPLLIWALALAPQLAGLAQASDQTLMDMRNIQAARSADLIDFFLPNQRNPWWGPAVRAARATIYPDAIIWNVALGWVGLTLAALAALASWRQTWRWTALLFGTMLLAMGPTLRLAGYATGLPLPFAIVQNLPGIRAGQRPNHMAVIAVLMLALLAAHGVAWLTRRLPPRGGWALAAALVVAVVVVDGYAGPLQIVRRDVHPFLATLPAPDGALIPLPTYVNVNRSENMTAQMTHRWPILGGYVARPPAYPFAAYTPGVRELQSGAAERDDILTPGWPESGRRALSAYAIRYVVMDLTSQKDAYFAQVRGVVGELGLGPPLVADSTLEAYAVPRTWAAVPVAFLGPGWQPLERQPGTIHRWRWMGEQAEVLLFNPYQQPVIATISIAASSYQHQRALHLALDNAGFGQIAIAPDRRSTHTLRLLLAPGDHRLSFRADAAPDPGHGGAPISARFFQIAATFSAPLASN